MNRTRQCLFCKGQATFERIPESIDAYSVKCEYCGGFNITGEIEGNVADKLSEFDKATISSFLYDRKMDHSSIPSIVESDPKESDQVPKGTFLISVNQILNNYPLPDVVTRFDKTLLNLRDLTSSPGSEVLIENRELQVGYAENTQALQFILNQLAEDKLITINPKEISQSQNSQFSIFSIVLTHKGWKRVSEIEAGYLNKANKQCFVAMSFDISLDKTYKNGLKRAINESGYSDMRIDLKEHNNQIVPEIIAEIRKSRFMVADFTFNRPGVYFEAGYMQALGRPVILTCKSDHKKDIHFDTQQFSYIFWSNDEDLRKKLKARIEATVIA